MGACIARLRLGVDPTAHRAAVGEVLQAHVDLGVEAPTLLAGAWVQREDAVERRAVVEPVLHHDGGIDELRRRLARGIVALHRRDRALPEIARAVGPGQLKPLHVLRRDLRRRRVVSAASGATVGRPADVLAHCRQGAGQQRRGSEPGSQHACQRLQVPPINAAAIHAWRAPRSCAPGQRAGARPVHPRRWHPPYGLGPCRRCT